MALFDESVEVAPAERRRLPQGAVAGLWALAVALVVLVVLTFLPTSYVIQQPGPVFNTLGTAPSADGEQVPLISVKDAETHPTSGTLDLTTVQVVGNRQRPPSWLELIGAWFDPARAVVPIDAVFPAGQTSEQRDEESAGMMVDSQKDATAAALTQLGHDVGTTVEVVSVLTGSPAEGALKPGDVIVAVDGDRVADADQVRADIQASGGDPVELTVRRDGAQRTVTVTPRQGTQNGSPVWLVGVTLTHAYDFPIDVTIQLDNVGGPSAGMMFALGIIDVLTPGELTGGANIAGTGTIASNGVVGPIGGIRQKMFGARGAGAEYFLAPTSNCDEVVGHVPSGLRVLSVDTLDHAMDAVEAIADGGDLDALPTCTAG